jgi:hypothetical protein
LERVQAYGGKALADALRKPEETIILEEAVAALE